MRDNRRHVRVRPSGLVSKTAKIVVGEKAPTIDCYIIDLSAGGACLEVSNPGALPKRFVLFHAGTKKSCRLVWQTGRRFGVAFLPCVLFVGRIAARDGHQGLSAALARHHLVGRTAVRARCRPVVRKRRSARTVGGR